MAKVYGQPKNLKQLGPIEITKSGVARFYKQKRGRKPKSQKKSQGIN